MLASVLRIVLMLAAVYAAAAVMAHLMSRSMLFPHPPPSYALTPDLVQVTAPDGTRVVCRHWPNPTARFTLFWFHGNGEDLGAVAEYIQPYVQAGFAVFALEYRGYGQSGGTPNESGLYADAALGLDWLKRHGTPPARTILFGYSLGGGVAIELATHERVAGLVLQSCFVSAYRVMTRVPLFPWDKFENLKKLPRVQCPVLVIHGTADEVVPVWHGEKLFAAAPGPKARLFVAGAPHGDVAGAAGEAYWQALQAFAAGL